MLHWLIVLIIDVVHTHLGWENMNQYERWDGKTSTPLEIILHYYCDEMK